ncbi:hypothetical protein C427_5183 [Paraglaciecola psychrophila 170]|uniref:Uncharacterized protein n=1 Tax=Paraglaciecola psychrophila 170 TaxID=1129794 RepID=M4S9D5_9ALTE|nr:hypothetical protein C427_5183 [Paraglaciecola psychrophila 170]
MIVTGTAILGVFAHTHFFSLSMLSLQQTCSATDFRLQPSLIN